MPARPPFSPFVRKIIDATVPAAARRVVDFMRMLEEANLDPAARWELLRRRLEQLGRPPERSL
jgi:hypothetical protein